MLGCDHLVAKPFKLEELLDTLDDCSRSMDPRQDDSASHRCPTRDQGFAALRNFARRGEVAGFLEHLQRLRERSPELQAVLDDLHASPRAFTSPNCAPAWRAFPHRDPARLPARFRHRPGGG